MSILSRSSLATLALLAFASCSEGGGGSTEPDPDPGTPGSGNQVYRVTLTGATGFLSGGGQAVSQTGYVVIMPTLDNSNATGNGVNPVDVAIVTDASPLLGAAGALWFGTNTSTCVVVSCSIGASRIDIAFVSRAGNRISIRVDGNVFGLPAARLNTFNIYNVTSGVTAHVHNVLLGELLLDLNGSQLAGQMLLNGNSGFSGPSATSYYQATIAGQLQS